MKYIRALSLVLLIALSACNSTAASPLKLEDVKTIQMSFKIGISGLQGASNSNPRDFLTGTASFEARAAGQTPNMYALLQFTNTGNVSWSMEVVAREDTIAYRRSNGAWSDGTNRFAAIYKSIFSAPFSILLSNVGFDLSEAMSGWQDMNTESVNGRSLRHYRKLILSLSPVAKILLQQILSADLTPSTITLDVWKDGLLPISARATLGVQIQGNNTVTLQVDVSKYNEAVTIPTTK